MSIRGIQKLATLASSLTNPVTLAGGAAGLGTMALIHSIMDNSLAAKKQVLDKALGDYAKAKSVPLLAGAITALLVGAMVASKVRAQQSRVVPFTPSQAQFQSQGFLPGERTQVGRPQSYPGDPVLMF